MSDAGADSPHLAREEREQAAQHAAPAALVIHEAVREEGEQELRKRPVAVWWSGLAAGMSMGFSFLCMAMLGSMLPATPWRHAIASAGYTVGFVITILGRQELFTESTLTAFLPLLVRRDRATFVAVLRFWAVVLVANLAGTAMFATLLSRPGLFPRPVLDTLGELAKTSVDGVFIVTMARALLAGWLIALMAWMLPSARSARFFVILLLTYVVALCSLPHVVAGSVESAYAVLTGAASMQQYLGDFLVPTLIGNTIGGVALVAMLNHAPLADELKPDRSRGDSDLEP